MQSPANLRRVTWRALGFALWLLAVFATFSSFRTVQARISRLAQTLRMEVPFTTLLTSGDAVFLQSDEGLIRIGEVTSVQTLGSDVQFVGLSLSPEGFGRLNGSARAKYWQTPLSAQSALASLMPAEIVFRAAERIRSDWKSAEERVLTLWAPVAEEMGSAYLGIVAAEIKDASRKRQDDILALAQEHGARLAERWPRIQQRLTPILEANVTPVMSRLLTGALSEAPKLDLAMLVAKGDFGGAFQRMLDAVAQHLANLSASERKEIEDSLGVAWESARSDPLIAAEFSDWSRQLVNDERLRTLVAEIYQDAVGKNPRIKEFLRREILESPRVRDRFFEFVEIFGPTAREVLAIFVFDEHGRTRPEVVHLLRSVSLGRRLVWVTIENRERMAGPLKPGALIPAEPGDPRE